MIIQVHNGTFHADDVIFAALCMMEVEDKEISFLRSREIKEGDNIIIGDVGEVYDPERNMYDHHQEECPVYDNGIKHSACGLYLKHMTCLTEIEKQMLLDKALYAVQANDNGQDVDRAKYPNPFTYINALNANWEIGVYSPEQDELFIEAVKMTCRVLDSIITNIRAEIKASVIIVNAIGSDKFHDNGVLEIDDDLPWDKTVIGYNATSVRPIKMVMYISNGQYKIQVVPKYFGTFEALSFIPKQVEQMDECIFRHKAGFLAGFKTRKAALDAANISVAINPKSTANALGYAFTW